MSGMSKQDIERLRRLIDGYYDPFLYANQALTCLGCCLDEIERLQKLCEVTLKDYCERAEK